MSPTDSLGSPKWPVLPNPPSSWEHQGSDLSYPICRHFRVRFKEVVNPKHLFLFTSGKVEYLQRLGLGGSGLCAFVCTGVLSEGREGWARQPWRQGQHSADTTLCYLCPPATLPSWGKNRSTEFETRPGLHLGAKLVPVLSSVGGRLLPVAGSGLPCRNPLLGNSPGPKTQ